MSRIKKRKLQNPSHNVKKSSPPDDYMKFSFLFFDGDDLVMCPASFTEGYTKALMGRLKYLSNMKMSEFLSNRSKALRAHIVDWKNTTRPNGFTSLDPQYEGYPGYQFQITRSTHGRVHGIIINGTFYIIWLDCNHALYSK